MLDIKHISKTFNPGTITEKLALHDVSLHLGAGDFVTVIGGNGAGKCARISAVPGTGAGGGGPRAGARTALAPRPSRLPAPTSRSGRSTSAPSSSAASSRTR